MILANTKISLELAAEDSGEKVYTLVVENSNKTFTLHGLRLEARIVRNDNSIIEKEIRVGTFDASSAPFICSPDTTCDVLSIREDKSSNPALGIKTFSASAKDIRGYYTGEGLYLETGKSWDTIQLNGKINHDTVKDVRVAILRNDKRFNTFHIDSLGGDVESAMAIGRIIQSNKWGVNVRNTCVGACVLILAAGVSKTALGSHIGIHRPYFESLPSSRSISENVQAAEDSKKQEVQNYLQDMNVSVSLLDAMYAVPRDEIQWLTDDQIKTYGLHQIDPVTKTVLDDKAAKDWGLSGGEYYRRRGLAENRCSLEHWLMRTFKELSAANKESVSCQLEVLKRGY